MPSTLPTQPQAGAGGGDDDDDDDDDDIGGEYGEGEGVDGEQSFYGAEEHMMDEDDDDDL